MKYFSNLHNGWADLTIGDFTCPCSYIQNVPMEILRAYDEFEKNGHCIINIDSEGYEHEIIITELGVHVITYRDRLYYHNLTNQFESDIDKKRLLRDLFRDIVDNADEWARWMCITDPHSDCYERIIEEYKNTILRYAEKL